LNELDRSEIPMNKTVCISGANGFLGEAIVRKLQDNGYQILALTRNLDGIDFSKKVSTTKYVAGDLSVWCSAILDFEPKIVISCDWQGVSGEARSNEDQNNNIERIKKLADTAREIEAKTFLTFGSQAEVAPSFDLIGENVEDSSQDLYGTAKASLRKVLSESLSDSNTKLIWGRIFTIYGPGDVRNSIIVNGIKSFLNHENFEVVSGSRKWSFLYIDDFANAILKILESEDLPEVVNIGNPDSVKLSSVKNEINEILEFQMHQFSEPKPENPKPDLTWIPQTTTLSALGWKPQISFHYGMEKTIAWWRLNV